MALALGVNTGLALTGGASREFLVLPLAAGLGLCMGALALTRFAVFTLTLLVLRTVLDLGKLSEGSAGGDPASLLGMLFLLAGGVWLAARRRSDGPAPASSLRFALAFFVLAGLLSLITANNVVPGLVELSRIAAAAMMFWVLDRLLVDRAMIPQVLAAVYASAVIPLLGSAYGALTGNLTEVEGGFTKVLSTFPNSNGYSRYLMFLLIMGVALYRHVDRRWRLPYSLLLAGLVGAQLLTYTRSGWLAALAGVAVVALLQSRALIGGLLIGGVVVALLVPSVGARLSDLSVTEGTSTTSGNSLLWRLSYWNEVLPMAGRNPITGVGVRAIDTETVTARQPHNDFVRAYVETGLVGLAAYLWLLVAMLGTARKALQRAAPGLERGVAVGFAGCVAAFFLVSVVANVISAVAVLWSFFAFAAAANAIGRAPQPQPGPEPAGQLAPVGAPAAEGTAN